MAGTIGTDIAKNYRQQIVPFSRFGTRKVVWFKVGAADVADGGGVLDMAEFNKVIDVIQTRAEIVTIGAPYIDNDNNWNKFMVAVFEDTFNDGSNTIGIDDPDSAGYNDMSTSLQNALQAALDNIDIYVMRMYLYGAPPSGSTDEDYGFSVQASRQEYDTKAEFVTSSYTQD